MKYLFISLLLLCSSSFVKAQSDSGMVCMPAATAKKVAQELIIGDSAKSLLSITEIELGFTKQKLGYKDSIILTGRLIELNLINQLKNEQMQKAGYVALLDDNKKEYDQLATNFKKYKVRKTFTDIMFTTGILLLTWLLIYK